MWGVWRSGKPFEPLIVFLKASLVVFVVSINSLPHRKRPLRAFCAMCGLNGCTGPTAQAPPQYVWRELKSLVLICS